MDLVQALQWERDEEVKEVDGLAVADRLATVDALWVCGAGGLLARSHDGGASWTRIATSTTSALAGIALAADAVWVCGADGFAARVCGDTVEPVALGTSTRLRRVCAMAGVALGDDGALHPLDAREPAVATGAPGALTDLVITAHGTWIVVGEAGFIARSPDGRWFSRVVIERSGSAPRSAAVGERGVLIDGELDLHAVAEAVDGTLVAVGAGRALLASRDDGRTWRPIAHADATRLTRARTARLDDVLAAGPDGFIAGGLAEFLAHTAGATRARVTRPYGDDFARDFGVPLPDEARRFFALVDGRDAATTFDELRVDGRARPRDVTANLFEQLVCERELVDAFCGVFAIGTQGNGDSYHLEIYEWDGPRQVLHFDHETASFTGVFADSLDSLAYLCALVKAGDAHEIAPETYAAGLRALHGRVSPTWHFSIDDKDPDFVRLAPTRHNTEFFYCRARWICALLETGDVDDVRELFDANLNEVIALDQLPARFDACARYIPTSLYAMWRAYLFDEPELARYLELGRAHAARLVRDAAHLIEDLRGGRTRLGAIADVPAWLARFRALDLDPRRTEARAAEAAERARHAARRRDEVAAELAHAPEDAWPQLAWSWLHDGSAHRALILELGARPDGAAALAALESLGELGDDERELAIPRIAGELAPVIEALLLGSLVRDDRLDDLPRDQERESEPTRPTPSNRQRTAALAMTARALRLAPHAADAQLAHAMLLLDADRAGVEDADRELLAMLPRFAATVRIGAACQMGGHPRFRDVLDIALADAPHDDVASEMYGELGEVVLEHAPDRVVRLVDQLPDDVELLCDLASLAIEAGERDGAVGLYDRMLAIPLPDEPAPRQSVLRALNNACIQAHAGKVYDAAVRIADRVQAIAHESPALFHAAACAYAAVGDLARAFEQVKRAIEFGYDHVARIAVDTDLRGLLEWPAFQALMRDVPPRAQTNEPDGESEDIAGDLADASRDHAPVAPGGSAPRDNPLIAAFADGGDAAVDTWISETPHPREDVARMLAELAVAIVTSDARHGIPGGAARPRQLVTCAGELLAARAEQGRLDPRAAPALRPVLDVVAKFEHRRRAVVDILGAMRDRDAVAPMLRILGASAVDKEDLLAAVARALGAIADPAAIPMLARVVATSGAYLDKPRTYAANALAACLAVEPRPLLDDVLGGLLEPIARRDDALLVAHAHLAYARLARLLPPAQREAAVRRLADTPSRRDDAIVTLARQVALAIVRPSPMPPVEAELLREALHRALVGRSWDHDATVRDLALALAIGELVPALVEPADLGRLTRFAEASVRVVAHALLATLGRPLAPAACFDRETVRALSDDDLVRWLAESHVVGTAALVAEAGWRQLARARPTIVRLAGQVVATAPPRADLLEPHARLLAAAVAALRDSLDAPAIVLFDRMLRHPNPNVKWALLKHPPHDERLVGGMLYVLSERWGWQEAVARAWLEPYAGMPIYETERLRAAGSALQPDDREADPEDDAATN